MFQKLTEHIYRYPCDGYTDRPNIGLIVGTERALLFDAGNSGAHVARMRQALEQQGLPMPDWVALSHWHWDHSFGAHAWGVPILAGAATSAQLKTVQTWKWDDAAIDARAASGEDIVFCNEMIRREYPDRSRIRVVSGDVVFSDRLELELGGGVRCVLLHCAGPHAADSVLCYVPGDRFVFLGDSNCKDLYGLPWHFDIAHEEDFMKNTDALPYDPAKLEPYRQLLEGLDFTRCISGHAEPMCRTVLLQALQTAII